MPSEDLIEEVRFNPQAFAQERADNLRKVGREKWIAGDKGFLPRQHALFLHAYKSCLCAGHACTGCLVSLQVATWLEADIAKLDENLVLAEQQKALSIVDAKEQAALRFLAIVKQRHADLAAHRQGDKERSRKRSVARDHWQDKQS